MSYKILSNLINVDVDLDKKRLRHLTAESLLEPNGVICIFSNTANKE